ncbi:MAG: DUF2147 domain-containing protein [Rhizobiaceae bacterium]
MLRKLITAAAISALLNGSAFAEDMIVGNWKTQSGETAAISGGGSFSIVLKTGKYAGKNIGSMSGSNGKYSGTITDPADDKKYSGSARVSGSSMKMKGCALKVFCKTQTWTKM